MEDYTDTDKQEKILKKAYRTELHWHKHGNEEFRVIDGLVLAQTDMTMHVLQPGDSINILPGVAHGFIALADSKLAVHSAPDENDVYRLVEGGEIPDDAFAEIKQYWMEKIGNQDDDSR